MKPTIPRKAVFTIVIGLLIPLLTWFVVDAAVRLDASKGGPPNQGAMIIAYLVTRASYFVSLLLIAIGAFLALRSRRGT